MRSSYSFHYVCHPCVKLTNYSTKPIILISFSTHPDIRDQCPLVLVNPMDSSTTNLILRLIQAVHRKACLVESPCKPLVSLEGRIALRHLIQAAQTLPFILKDPLHPISTVDHMVQGVLTDRKPLPL